MLRTNGTRPRHRRAATNPRGEAYPLKPRYRRQRPSAKVRATQVLRREVEKSRLPNSRKIEGPILVGEILVRQIFEEVGGRKLQILGPDEKREIADQQINANRALFRDEQVGEIERRHRKGDFDQRAKVGSAKTAKIDRRKSPKTASWSGSFKTPALSRPRSTKEPARGSDGLDRPKSSPKSGSPTGSSANAQNRGPPKIRKSPRWQPPAGWR